MNQNKKQTISDALDMIDEIFNHWSSQYNNLEKQPERDEVVPQPMGVEMTDDDVRVISDWFNHIFGGQQEPQQDVSNSNRIFKIRHKQTGLFYRPGAIKDGKSSLTPTGKTYHSLEDVKQAADGLTVYLHPMNAHWYNNCESAFFKLKAVSDISGRNFNDYFEVVEFEIQEIKTYCLVDK